MNFTEAKDLNIYKKLVTILSDYTDKFPLTGANTLFKKVIEIGLKVVPKDKKAQNILWYILNNKKNVPAVIQELLNIRFADLPSMWQPIYKGVGGGKIIAFWNCDGHIYDKVYHLINLEKYKKQFWANEKGEKVELIINEED